MMGGETGVKHGDVDVRAVMLVYSLVLTVGLVAAAPWWLWRWSRYRAGLGERLGRVRGDLRAAVNGRDVIWVHAVSVGEVLAVERLVGELRASLPGWVVCVSTTTATGQAVARERFGVGTMFYFPLDFGFAVRAYVRALRPRLLVLAEGELWPRVLYECGRAGVPVAVVNARVSDRSYRRTVRVKGLWLRMGRRVAVFLAQGEETAGRLRGLGVAAERVKVVGNLKFEGGDVGVRDMVGVLREAAAGRQVVVAGSTLEGEEALALRAMEDVWKVRPETMLVLAPRHPERFAEVLALSGGVSASRLAAGEGLVGRVVVLDTLGDLAAVYGVAAVAFVGGSLVARGGHNPLEPARFGVPVLVGGSFENFREVVGEMRAARAIRIVADGGLGEAVLGMLFDGKAMGERGRVFYEGQVGVTERTVAALLELVNA